MRVTTVRHPFIDSLRVIAILLMFVYHVNMIFVAEWDWHIKDNSSSNVLLEINYWMSLFRMPLLFLVSGFVSAILLEKMKWQTFVHQRWKRLLIPTFIWTFILVAPQIYFERRLEGVQFSYIEFYQTFLDFKWYPEGNFHWLHLWFIPYLFCYNLLSIPVYYLLKQSWLIDRLNSFFVNPRSILIITTVAVIPYTFLSVHYPTTYDFINDFGRHSFFIFFAFAGLLFYKLPIIVQQLEENRRFYLSLSFISILTINMLRWNGWEPFDVWENWISKPQTYFFIALVNLNSWFWVLSSIGYGKKYLNRKSKLLTYCNKAVYPFYILHQTIIVIIGYYVVQTPDDPSFKYWFLLLVCFALCVLTYHLCILPYGLMRFLFGMKKKTNTMSIISNESLKDNRQHRP